MMHCDLLCSNYIYILAECQGLKWRRQLITYWQCLLEIKCCTQDRQAVTFKQRQQDKPQKWENNFLMFWFQCPAVISTVGLFKVKRYTMDGWWGGGAWCTGNSAVKTRAVLWLLELFLLLSLAHSAFPDRISAAWRSSTDQNLLLF